MEKAFFKKGPFSLLLGKREEKAPMSPPCVQLWGWLRACQKSMGIEIPSVVAQQPSLRQLV